MQSALRYPADFDGILAGAPATDFNHLMYWAGMLGKYVGAPLGDASPAFLSPELWKAVAGEVMTQCDALDGVHDGIIDEPDACDFRPEALMCRGDDEDLSVCLTPPQVDALQKIYAPLYADGELIYPRFDPGAEGSPAMTRTFSGDFPAYPRVRIIIFYLPILKCCSPLTVQDWIRYVILNDSDFDMRHYGPAHGVLMEAQNPGGIATFDGDLSAFRDRGGKFLTYHGRRDSVCLASTFALHVLAYWQ
jgi:feruloyl esterase